jgi:UDP-N-acetylglucosamine acyltransferase
MPDIHPTAVVADGAEVGQGTCIGPYSVVGAHVRIGRNNVIGPHVVIEGRTSLGDENKIYQFASVGAPPQDLRYKGEESFLEIGNGNVIREYVTLQPGTAHGLMRTKIGNNNLFMACSHIAHDVIVGDSNIFANSASLAGHVAVGSGVIVGGLAGIHQFVRLGDRCILGAGSMIPKDVPPFCMVQGDRARLTGINKIGLQRAGYSKEDIRRFKRLFRHIFFGGAGLRARVSAALLTEVDYELGFKFLDFLNSDSERGITLPSLGKRAIAAQDDDSD